jgi:hypothetical protein
MICLALLRNSVVMIVVAASPLAAQIQHRPTDPPLVTAANESWYQLREPIQFGGDLYYRAGPAVFFDGNIMVRSGHYNGVPLYMDTTIEPYSVVLVPVRIGLMQPYERLRRGDLAGTTGSRTPSFPVRATADRFPLLQAPTAPTAIPLSMGSIPAGDVAAVPRAATTVGTDGVQFAESARSNSTPMSSVTRPENNQGLWIHYQGIKWVSAGRAVPLRSTDFRAVGQYEGFPVFVRQNEEKTIYLPTRAGLVAPYKAS